MNTLPDIVTVGEMIDSAFGDAEKNVVHHKLIQAVLIILAKQLRMLDRRIKLELFHNPDFYSSSSSLSVTEVKIQAIKKKRRSTRPTSATARGKGPYKGTGPSESRAKGTILVKGLSEETGPEGERHKKPARLNIPRATAETIEDYAKGNISITEIKTRSLRSDPKHGTVYPSRVAMYAESHDQEKNDRGAAGRITFLGDDQSSTSEEYLTTTSEQVTTDKTSTEKTSSNKTTTESPTDKTTTESPTDKTTTESSTDKTTSKSSTGKTTTESPTDKTTTGSSTDKTTSKSRTDKTTTESPNEKTTTKSATDKTTSSFDKTSTSKSKSIEKASVAKPMKTASLSDKRADSREERDKTPTPMASMDTLEVQYEKILVVERVPSEEAKARVGRLQDQTRGKYPKLSIVTQEEFANLADIVRKLQDKFDPIGAAEFPENIQLMQELRKGASLTDAMAALQLSARLEAVEKALSRMTSLITEIASKYSDIDLTALTEPAEPETEVLYQGAPGPSSKQPRKLSKTPAFAHPPKPKTMELKTLISKETTEEITTSELSGKREETVAVPVVKEERQDVKEITIEHLENALQEIYENVMSSLSAAINKSKANSELALNNANRLEVRLNAALNLGNRMEDLEELVADYAEKINVLDTGLSSQMTHYQEQLTQMQHDLETGLENMAEALANTGGDTTAMAELNSHFTNLQLDFEITNARQNELKDVQNNLKNELENLKRQIEVLRSTKSDRDEVTDALQDKVGLGTLNGLTTLEHFDAVRGDLEQRISAAYDKFNNQELVWQKSIDEIFRELGEKADWTQIVFLREDIKRNIEKLKDKIQVMLDIVGEPQAATVSRKLYRDTNCLSCSTPAHMGLEESTIPNLPAMPGARPPTLGAESPQKQKEYNNHGVCYPNLPIPHPREPRAHLCNRYCGGSHTKIPATLPRTPAGMLIRPTGGEGSKDAKTKRKPCIPCNVNSKVTNDHEKSKPENEEGKMLQDAEKGDAESNFTDYSADFVRMSTQKNEGYGDSVATTPPVLQTED